MVERFAQSGGRLFAVMSRGRLLAATIGEWEWQEVVSEASAINAVAVWSSA
jgi:hypothetical protein